MKRNLYILLAVVLSLVLTGCCLSHEWVEADCDSPKTCAKCGETEGESLGHTWVEADCDSPRTCTKCGETEGESLGHTWLEATCTESKTCSVCGETEGEALGHTWLEATCTEPKICSVCSQTEGVPVHANVSITMDEKDGNAVWVETCRDCGEADETVYEDWNKLAAGHFIGRWETAVLHKNGDYDVKSFGWYLELNPDGTGVYYMLDEYYGVTWSIDSYVDLGDQKVLRMNMISGRLGEMTALLVLDWARLLIYPLGDTSVITQHTLPGHGI